MGIIQPAHMFPQPALIDGADLLQQYHRILAQTYAATGDIDMGGESCLSRLAGDGGGDDGGRMPVAGIVLNDKDRTGPPCSLPTTGERSA